MSNYCSFQRLCISNQVELPAAGLAISQTLGLQLRHNFCCRGPISNSRSGLDSSSQTTRIMLPDFFDLKTFFVTVFIQYQKSVSKGFQALYWPFDLQTIFLVSRRTMIRAKSQFVIVNTYRFLIFPQEIDVYLLKYCVYTQARYYRGHPHQLDFLK